MNADAAFKALKEEIAQRNETAHREARKLRAASAQEIDARRRREEMR